MKSFTISIMIHDKVSIINDTLLTFIENNLENINKNKFYLEFTIVTDKKIPEIKEIGIFSLPALKFDSQKETIIKQGNDDIITFIKDLCNKQEDEEGRPVDIKIDMREIMKSQLDTGDNEEDSAFDEKERQKKMNEFNQKRAGRKEEETGNNGGGNNGGGSNGGNNRKLKPHQLNTPNTPGPNKSTYKIDVTETKEDVDIMRKLDQQSNNDYDDNFDDDDNLLMSKGM